MAIPNIKQQIQMRVQAVKDLVAQFQSVKNQTIQVLQDIISDEGDQSAVDEAASTTAQVISVVTDDGLEFVRAQVYQYLKAELEAKDMGIFGGVNLVGKTNASPKALR